MLVYWAYVKCARLSIGHTLILRFYLFAIRYFCMLSYLLQVTFNSFIIRLYAIITVTNVNCFRENLTCTLCYTLNHSLTYQLVNNNSRSTINTCSSCQWQTVIWTSLYVIQSKGTLAPVLQALTRGVHNVGLAYSC